MIRILFIIFLLPLWASAATLTDTNLLWNFQNGTNQAIYPMLVQPSDTSKGPFNAVTWDTLFGSTYDQTFSIGYNTDHGGGRIKNTEPSFRFTIEQDYQVGSTHYLESYFEWVNKGGTGQRRPIFWQFDRDTGAMNANDYMTEGTAFKRWSTGETFANLNPYSIVMRGVSDQPDNTQLVLASQNGKFASIQLAGGMLIRPVENNRWALQVGSVGVIEMFSDAVSIGGSQNFSGTLTVVTPVADKDNHHTLSLRAADGQTTGLVIAGTAANPYLFVVTPDGSIISQTLKSSGVHPVCADTAGKLVLCP